MTKLIVDGIEVEVPAEYTLLQACEAAGAEIPRFCFHERLSIAGNCRMCLVELKGAPKPVASCAWAVRDCRPGPNGEPPVINTRTPTVKKAREGVMEFLLINHPLDCPICDQGGECDLQDQAMAYGVDTTRFHENKRAVEDKYIGPLVKTSMNRCIHCTRCVRFVAEVAGVEDLGAIGRGEDMEITTYLEKAMRSELQANVADLCPVGALTHKPQAFNYRPWELSKTPSVDVMDAVGSAIRVDARGREVMRILPRVNEAVNEEWISDKTRQVVDGLRLQRLDRPFLRENGRLRPASWPEAFAAIAGRMQGLAPKRIGAIVGDLAAVEEIFALKLLMQSLGVTSMDCRQDGAPLHPDLGRASYLFNSTIAGIESADAILMIGANPRVEASLVNARIRKRWRAAPLSIGVIGERADLTYPYDYLGAGPETLADLVAGRHGFAEKLRAAQRPLVIVGAGALARLDGLAIVALAAQAVQTFGAAAEGWSGFNVLHTCGGARRRPRSRLRAGGGRPRRLRDRPSRRGRRDLQSRRRRDRHRGRAFRDLPGHARRPRRAAGRRHPARRRLHGEIRHLRQHGRARADGQPRLVPAGRRARGLGHSAGALRRARAPAAVRFAAGPAPDALRRRIRISPRSTRSRRATPPAPSAPWPASAARRAGSPSSARCRIST